MIRLLHGDCLDLMRDMPDNSVDAAVLDPPYGLSAPPDVSVVLRAWLDGEAYEHGAAGFMGKDWDSFVPGPRVFRELFRVLKPGSHVVCFAGTRTLDLMGISMRLAQFEIRDTLHWCYWSGFPKSLSMSLEMDRIEGAVREIVGRAKGAGTQDPISFGNGHAAEYDETAPASPMAVKWDGFGTGIKPAVEPAILARKPISETSIARNVLKWGTGALNIDACRFKPGDVMWPGPQESWQGGGDSGPSVALSGGADGSLNSGVATENTAGRFPANLLYCAKSSRRERERGCGGLPAMSGADAVGREEGSAGLTPRAGAGRSAEEVRNGHPTVKPIRLMQYLVRLVGCQPGSVILDPFMGSGTTGIACVSQGYSFIGCELSGEYIRIARARIGHAAAGKAIEAPDIALEGVEKPQQVGMF